MAHSPKDLGSRGEITCSHSLNNKRGGAVGKTGCLDGISCLSIADKVGCRKDVASASGVYYRDMIGGDMSLLPFLIDNSPLFRYGQDKELGIADKYA